LIDIESTPAQQGGHYNTQSHLWPLVISPPQ